MLQLHLPRFYIVLAALLFLTACESSAPTAAPSTDAIVTPSPVVSAGPSPTDLFAPSPTDLFVPSPTFPNLKSPTLVPYVEITPPPDLHVGGTFVFGPGDGSLNLQDAETGNTRVLVARSKDSLAQLPAFSPDAKTVAYSALLFNAQGTLTGDVRLIQSDGQADHVIAKAQSPDEVYFYPRWYPDGKSLLVTHASKPQTSVEQDELMQVSAQGGAPRLILKNGRDADISADARKIAFVRLDPKTYTFSLWSANADGSGEQQLAPPGIFSSIAYPRFSPDGAWIAFSVTGVPPKPLTRAGSSCGVSLLFVCLVQAAEAHGAPGALWRVSANGKHFEALMDLYEDSPSPAWSHDGAYVAINDIGGISLIDLIKPALYPIYPESGGIGGFDWK